jgi:hypothetical protein
MGRLSMTAAIAPKRFAIALDEEAKRFLNWALIWVLLANIGYMALWFVGAPPRALEIGIIGFAGLIAKRFNFWLRYGVFLIVSIYAALVFLGGLFNLSLASLLYSVKFFFELKPANASEYITVAVALLLIFGMVFRLMRRDQNFSKPGLIIAAGAMVIGLSALDFHMGREMRGHYMRVAPAGAEFSSATGDTNFAVRADGKRHLVLIMVEAMGLPKDNPELSGLLFRQIKDDPRIVQRYELKQGQSLYYNSTTAGEVRELCGRWGDYYDLVDRKDADCLPAVLARKGYATAAMHSFTSSFFKRGEWYPNVGFETTEFQGELRAKGARACGGVFAGACDRDIPKQISAQLKASKKPTFLYWLTLNSHLPVPPGLNLNVDRCEKFSPTLQRDFPQICRQFKIYHDIDTALVAELAAADFPEADILIVGDHMPPYFDKHHRSQFDPEHVPYLYLKHRGGAASPAGN